MAFGESTPRVAYRGFVSYSHKDAGIGRTIHRRLEGYRLPKHLIGSETALGAVPARLTPIFRDREELSAGESLSDQVQAALAASDCLIVLCSPDSKASKWVAKEIETFRALHPGRPVLAALIAGEPAEAFPDALTAGGAEPIAGDFRKEGDGMRLALLKLVAGMTGISLDALVQRDAQRRLRGVMAITGGAIIALLILSALLVVALRARAEADRQRAEAEGLVEYMLTDLRDRLKGVGRLDVMTAVNERAMKFYGGQGDLERLSPESLDRRARILHAMGEDDDKRGDLGLALKKFGEAHRTTGAVLAQRPNDADAIFAHAQSEYWVGYELQMLKRFREALAHDKEYGRLARRYAVATDNSRAAKMEVGWSENTIGALYLLNLKEPETAAVHFDKYASIFSALVKTDPKDTKARYSLADAYGWLADARIETKAWQEARALRLKQLAELAILRESDPQNVDTLYSTIAAKRGLFYALYVGNLNREAERTIIDALEMLSERKIEPTNVTWRILNVKAQLDYGHLLHRLGRISEARMRLRHATELARYRSPGFEVSDLIQRLSKKLDLTTGT